MAERKSFEEAFKGYHFWPEEGAEANRRAETRRHNVAEEDISRKRLEKDLENAQLRQETALAVQQLRNEAAMHRDEVTKLRDELAAQDRNYRTLIAQTNSETLKGQLERQREKDLSDREEKIKDRERKAAEAEQKAAQKVESELEVKVVDKYDEMGRPEVSRTLKGKDARDFLESQKNKPPTEAEKQAEFKRRQAEADATLPWYKQMLPFVHAPLAAPKTNAIPIPGTPAITPPPMPSTIGTGTNATAPQFAPVPSVGGPPVPALPTNTGAVPALGSQFSVPPNAGGDSVEVSPQTNAPSKIRVVHPSGRTGWIPADQKDSALQQGFKLIE